MIKRFYKRLLHKLVLNHCDKYSPLLKFVFFFNNFIESLFDYENNIEIVLVNQLFLTFAKSS